MAQKSEEQKELCPLPNMSPRPPGEAESFNERLIEGFAGVPSLLRGAKQCR